jgi:hypothetical protein
VDHLEAALAKAEASEAECVMLDLRRLRLMQGVALRTILSAHRRLTGRRALLLVRRLDDVGPVSVPAQADGERFSSTEALLPAIGQRATPGYPPRGAGRDADRP